jgi:hypothetical protein
LAKVVHINIEL